MVLFYQTLIETEKKLFLKHILEHLGKHIKLPNTEKGFEIVSHSRTVKNIF